ncbi:MAG TPA: trehalose-phosphatase [Egibacteraceae bacterium]|nr:trehalose-phosphatase [Egibacteraceae bacterium]
MSEGTPIHDLPDATDPDHGVVARLDGRTPAVFLDYDGTLTPIVERAEDATIDDRVREVIRSLADRCTVAIVSGRDLADVRTMVGVDGLYYAGSHGFDIVAPDGTPTQHGTDFLPALDTAEGQLHAQLAGADGVRIERKRFAIAVHYRQVDPAKVSDVKAAVVRVSDANPELRVTGGKKIFELRPALDWHKGKALQFLLRTLGLDERDDVVPIYVGDDVTDEDAFAALGDRGVGLVVRGEDDARTTFADVSLQDPRAVVTFLAQLRDALGDAAP